MINSQALMRIPRSNWYVLLGRKAGWNGSQRFGPLLLFLMVVLAAPTQSGCGGSSGVNVQPPQQLTSYAVTLDWAASTSPVIGYDVYRGTASGGPYTLLNSSLVTATQYEDSSVQSGQTYYYVVTAVDSNDVESTYSNQVSETIPTP